MLRYTPWKASFTNSLRASESLIEEQTKRKDRKTVANKIMFEITLTGTEAYKSGTPG